MTLSPGSRLGPYEISARIGVGGMGEVYRAHDSRLRRDVAIKTSTERFSDRFELSPDGQRVLVATPAGSGGAAITVLLNWRRIMEK